MRGVLSSEDSRLLISEGLKEADRLDQKVAIAVVDVHGHLLAFQRHNDTMYMANDAAIAKARTAAGFRRSTSDMQRTLEAGKTAYLSLPGCLPLAGGEPITIRGQILGGLGVSGAPSSIDAEIATVATAFIGSLGMGAWR